MERSFIDSPAAVHPRAGEAPGVLSSPALEGQPQSATPEVIAFETSGLGLFYHHHRALADITLKVPARRITAIIGPSGCGKTSLLRCFNRMNELIPGTRLEGKVMFMGEDLYAPGVDPTEVRYRIGMVFQKPNPFPKSIYDNVAFGARINGFKGNMDDLVERAITQAALWDEVKDRLKRSAYELSGGQQQRLCIARALAVGPEVILMDEPASALDPLATLKIEDLMQELARDYTIIIVTHNMQQAARVSDYTAFLTTEGGGKPGHLVEFGLKDEIFTTPRDKRTQDYITGRFG
jgi:phosphate transport system ATP-binding protein